MVDCVVQEQYLCRLNENCCQRKESMAHQHVNAGGQYNQNRRHQRPDQIRTYNCKNHTENTNRKVIDQHLKTCRHMSFHSLVKFLDHESADWSHQHRAHQHRVLRRAYDNADYCDTAHNASAVSAYQLTSLISNQNRQKVIQHWGYKPSQLFIGNPSFFNKECCDKSPSNESSDVRHYHRT